MSHPFLSIVTLAIAFCTSVEFLQLSAQAQSDGNPRDDFTKWTDEKLRQEITGAALAREKEPHLSEAVRRGGETWRKLLFERTNSLNQWMKSPVKKDDFWHWETSNLNYLTAIRRLEGKSDPLRVLVAGKHLLTYSLQDSLDFSALVVNLDPGKETIFGLTRGGSDRSGRKERWRFEIRNDKGETLSVIKQFGFMGGGLSTLQDLEYGESWQVGLRLRDYVVLNKPGKYKMRLHYHNTEDLARRDTIEGLITVQSDEIQLELTPIRVYVTAEEREKARKWIAELPEEGPVKILMDGVLAAPDVLSPTSPPGRLQQLHTHAIPDLIDAALDPKLAPGKRAWVLGLLTGITGHQNPCAGFSGGSEILGSYEIESRNSHRSGSGKLDPEKQKTFAENWRVWKTDGYFTIEVPGK